MSKLNPVVKNPRPRLAGGTGMKAAVNSPEAELRRLVMSALLWEDMAYIDGVEAGDAIKLVLPNVAPGVVANIVKECRHQQKMRHMPLYLIRLMAGLPEHKRFVGDLLPDVCTRADMITDFMALYWSDGKCPVSNQVKKGLARAFDNFDEYQLAKYDRKTAIKLRDVLFLVHAKPSQNKADLYRRLANRALKTPDTWEVALSTGQDKKKSWERLISEGKLGALAFLRNLRNFEEAGVSEALIRQGFGSVRPRYLLPINFMAAATSAPKWTREIEELMSRSFAGLPKLSGLTVFVVDVSGSMRNSISSKSAFTRLDVAASMAMLAAEQCESIRIYATAGSDSYRVHQTQEIPAYRGFGLSKAITGLIYQLGRGGIFTRQCLDYIREQERETPDRILVFSDSQDCDTSKQLPSPFGRSNYIIDVSAHQHGINYQGVWDAEISGWSEHFMKFIGALEANCPKQ